MLQSLQVDIVLQDRIFGGKQMKYFSVNILLISSIKNISSVC